MNLFSFFFPKIIASSHSQYNKSITVIERFGNRELYAGGIQQSGPYTSRLWKKGLMDFFQGNASQYSKTLPYVKQIVVFGIGGGTLFPILHTIFPKAHITGVDIDPKIISFYKKYFSNGTSSAVSVLCMDAKKFLEKAIRQKKTYDVVIVDLYIGNDVPEFVTDAAFLASISRILTPGGILVWNYFCLENQSHHARVLLDKLSGIYHPVYRENILRNIFFYCRKGLPKSRSF
jgi:predicted membrane-bound spermidine synthase